MDLKNKHVLITQLRLFDFAGSEIVTLELAEEFSRRGARVSVVSGGSGDPLEKEFKTIKNVHLYKIDDPEFEKAYRKQPVDIAWIHHQIIPDIVLENYTKTQFIFNHMSAMLGLETPMFYCIEEALASAIVFNSEATARKVVEQGFFRKDDPRINILYNAAPEHFSNGQLSQNEEVKTVGVVSNHIPKEVKEALDLLEENDKTKIIRFGAHAGEVYKRITPADIERCDVVLTIGKTVQYAIVGSRPVYCYDRFGGPGYLTEENVETAMDRNFSGRGFEKKPPQQIASEIVAGYAKAREFSKDLRKKLQDTISLEKRVGGLIDDIKENKTSHVGSISELDILSYKTIRDLIATGFAGSSHEAKRDVAALKARAANLEHSLKKKDREITEAYRTQASVESDLETMRQSRSFRIGRFLTYPVRLLLGRK